MSIVGKLTLITGALCCSIASADLYTGHIASLEWKTHSADWVLLVTVESASSDRATTKLIEVFARDDDKIADAESIANDWEPPLRYGYQKNWKPDGEWLLFARRWDEKEPTIDHQVFLKNPRQASFLSAVTADGQVLEDRQRILAVVKKRLASGKRMTERQRDARRLVDKGEHPPGQQVRRRGTPEDFAPWLGGFQVPADIHIWDDLEDERSFDEDLWVNKLIVPADEAYREVLYDYWNDFVRMSHQERRRRTGGYPLFALVNYPGERTEQLLTRLRAIPQHQHFDVQSVLTYLRFYESEFDEEDRQLIGSWVLTTSNQKVQYDLMDNHQLLVHRRPIPFPHPSKHQREWYSKGRWNRHHGRLHLLGTALRFPGSNRFHPQDAPVPQLSHLPIIQIADDAITLDKNVVLERAAKPITIASVETEE